MRNQYLACRIFLYTKKSTEEERKENEMDIQEQRPCLEETLLSITQEHGDKRFSKYEIFDEAKKQLWLTAPLLSVNILLFCIQVVSIMFVGHVSELALSGASMAASFTSVTGFSLLTGSASALDTLCGQSNGAKQFHMLGIHLHRATFALLLISIPVACVWAYAGHILELLGQDPHISAETELYVRFSIPTIFAMAVLECQGRFLQSQNNVFPMILCTGITMLCIFHSVGSWFPGWEVKVLHWPMGFRLNAKALGPVFQPTLSIKSQSFLSLQFLRSAAMICLEIWSFETMVLLAGLLPNPTLETSVLSIRYLYQTIPHFVLIDLFILQHQHKYHIIYRMIPLGLGSAISIRVSNELGAARPEAAHLAVRVAMALVTIESILVANIMILGHKVWGYCYSREERLVNYFGEMMFYVAATNLCDGVQTVVNVFFTALFVYS